MIVPAALLLLLASTIPAAAAGIAAGCPTACGNISIPYPFGVGLKCSRQGFNLTCDQNHHQPPKLLLGDGTIQILNISLLRATARIKTKILSTPSLDFNYSWTGLPADGPYTLSVTENQFAAIGCGILANFVFPNSEELISVCASVCVTRRSVPSDGSCSGVGCCRTTVPIGLRSFDIRLRSLNQTPGWAAGFANKVFVVEQEWFRRNSRMLEQKFSPGVDDPSAMDLLAIPAVLDWTLGNSSCGEAKNRPDFGCRSANSLCVDSTEYSGYRCNCSDGFRGNPYVLNGCQDVDECEQPETYPCYGICINEMGSYRCICPSGTYGNPIIGRCFSSKKIFTGSGAVIAGAGIGIGLLALLAGIAFLVYKLKARRAKKLRENFFKRNRGLLLQQLISSNRHIADRMRIFGLKELEKATDNFDKTRILGRGGHGTVYKGILSDQRVVAIKKSKIIVQREIDQFINEVAILSQVNHRNVVQLFGCCLETEVPLLVYEFISNGTLSNHLHVLGARSLSWDCRLRIAAETARALAYLHSAASISVFHRDVKSANILLDGNFTAKVSDFGASRSVPLDLDLTGVATAIHGTYGYLDPEYYHTSRLTEKSDVYSFGVILAELLTRERPISNSSLPTDQNLAARFVWLLRNDRLFEILDQQVVEEGQRVDIEAVAALAEMCLRLRGEERPTMKEVEVELEALGGSRNRARHPWAAQRSEDSQSLQSHISTEDRAADMTRQYSLENELMLSSLPR